MMRLNRAIFLPRLFLGLALIPLADFSLLFATANGSESVSQTQQQDSTTVACLCTYKDCGSAFCENEYCIVGFKKGDEGKPSQHFGIIYQNCASEEAARKMNPCAEDVAPNWDEVCKCKKKRCNTYQYYRRAIDYIRQFASNHSADS